MGGRTATDHQRAALKHLREVLGDDAPSSLVHEATIGGRPLEREGDMSVFRFRASVGGSEEQAYYVVAGETVANYYPCWGLTPEEAYELHLGTRFMLVLEVQAVPCDALPPDVPQRIRAFIETVTPGAAVSEIVPAAGFRVEEAVYVVCRARIGAEPVYVLGFDCPPGIYRDVTVAPHVILRRHLGRLIRNEAEAESEG